MRNYLPILCLLATLPALSQEAAPDSDDLDAIAAVVDAYHAAAAAGDWQVYFDLMSEDGVFLGSDASERWTKAEFQRYAGNRPGWVYTPQSRHINLTPDGATAWFVGRTQRSSCHTSGT